MARIILLFGALSAATLGLYLAADTKPPDSNKKFLLRGTEGALPSEIGTDKTVVTKSESKDLGGAALKIELADTFGQKMAYADWTKFTTLCLDVANPGAADLNLEINLNHADTKNYPTRVVVPITVNPGKNAIRIPIASLKNTNGSAPNMGAVHHWYVANEGKPVTIYVGDVWLEGKSESKATTPATGPYTIKTDAARLERIKAAKPIKINKPIMYNTPEADAIMAGVEIFPPDNPWNTLIEDWPLHPNSQQLIASVGANKPLRCNQDMCFAIVPGDQKKVEVKIKEYAGESDPGPYPVPDIIPLEGWPAYFKQEPKLKGYSLEDVQRDKDSIGGDRHAIVLDPTNRKLYEFFRFFRTENGWTAEQASIFDLSSNKLRPEEWTSADAAGLPILPSIVRFDELKRGVIDHALRFTVTKTRKAYVYPARHQASRLSDENLPRMGERFRLKKDFDTSKFSKELRIILEALKRYGMFVADNGLDWSISLSADDRLPVLHEELRRIKGSDFEVVTPPQGYVPPK